MNKILLPLLFIFTAIPFVAAQIEDEDEGPVTFVVDGIRFQVNETATPTVSVMPLDDTYTSDITIPTTVTDPTTGISYNVTAIASEAFTYAKFTKLNIPASVTEISPDAFWYSSIASFTVDDDNPAFAAVNGVLYNKDCSTLCNFPPAGDFASFVFPESVTAIGDYAFCGIYGVNKFEFPSRVKKVGRSAYSGTGVKNVVVPAGVELGGGVFEGCTSLSSIVFPEGMTVLPDHTLTRCYSLKELTIPFSVEEIGDYALNQVFYYLITEFTCSDNLRVIGIGAFQQNTGLKKIVLGKKVERLGMYSFSANNKLAEIISYNPVPPMCEGDLESASEVEYTFSDVPATCKVSVPANAIEAYKAAWGKKFTNFEALPESGISDMDYDADKFEIKQCSSAMVAITSHTPVTIYSANGMVVTSVSAGNSFISLPAGLYVAHNQSAVQKFIVK